MYLTGQIKPQRTFVDKIYILDNAFSGNTIQEEDSNWRFIITSSGELNVEKRVAGVWTYSSSFIV